MTPKELIEIEKAMTTGPWKTDPSLPSGLRCELDYKMPANEHDATGLAAARNRLKDLAELWAWAEKYLGNFDGICTQYEEDLDQILTRLRGEE